MPDQPKVFAVTEIRTTLMTQGASISPRMPEMTTSDH
jgi:hypothetical protein